MAQGFELYHIPQQSRREKLRVVLQNHHEDDQLQGCAGLDVLPLYHQPSFISSSPNLLSCANASSNNSTIIDNDHCNFEYTHQDLQAPFHGGDNIVALSLSSHNGTPAAVGFMNLQSYGGDLRRSAVVTFTGYASILKGSKFLKPAREMLDEICDVGFGIYADKFDVDCGLMTLTDPLPLMDSLRMSVDPVSGGVDKIKRSKLISLLDQVYKRYKQYYRQIEAVIASFEPVAGLTTAAPFAKLGLKAMSKHFRCLNNAITDHLQFSVRPHEHRNISNGKEDLVWSGTSNEGLYGQMAVNNLTFVDHQPVWRPQRGLPKRAVTVLRAWLFDHFLHPYPTDADKQSLANQTGLSRNQVSNWFINARVRVWKPMVEEVHTLETRQVHKTSSHIQEQNPPSKRARNDFRRDNECNDHHHHIIERNKEHMNFYDNFSINTANRGVSLTLGLQQNNNVITLNCDGLGARNRQVGGQFLHDFRG